MIKTYCSYSLDQVRDSGLIPPARMVAVEAEIESRIEKCYDSQGRVVDNCALAVYPSGKRWLYPRMAHDPKDDYIRRELLGEVLTEAELKLVNADCHKGWRAAADAKHFAAAQKLESWDGWVTDGDSYWRDVETYLDERAEEEWTHPYLWVATSQPVITDRLDVADVTEHYVSDRGWKDMDVDDLEGVKELQAALDAFVEANRGVVSYTQDKTRVVLLADYLRTKKRMDEADEECNRTGIHPIHQR